MRLRRPAALALGLAALAAGPAPAQEIVVNATIIDRARAEGVIGERHDGYLGFVTGTASDEVRRQVGKTNIKRRVLYGEIAAKRGVTRQDVGTAAGCEIFSRLGVGDYYQLDEGSWRRRAPGEKPPRPSYCG